MKETFGEFIRKLRNNRGFTLTQLAATLGIDSSALSKIETGKKVFDENLLRKLSEIFDLDENKIRDEYYSETIARILFDKHCSDEVLSMAASKALLLRNRNIKQANINFK
jgi:transcriptional regulator with XRE-family HTH domain